MGEETGLPETKLLVSDLKGADKWNCACCCYGVVGSNKNILYNHKEMHQQWVLSREALNGFAC